MDTTNEFNDRLTGQFKPLADIAYVPTRAIEEITGLNNVISTLIFTMMLGFILSFGFNFLTLPKHRKLYSVVTGLFLGFYFHGLGYFVCLA